MKTVHTIQLLALTAFLLHLLCGSAFSTVAIHQSIRGPFHSVRDVTGACLKCHRQQALEVLQSTHWTWVRQRTVNGKSILFSKKDALTGFAIDVSSNPTRCMGCHISNSRPQVNFDTPTPEMVDCLVCHDTTGKYGRKTSGVPGENSPEDLELMARNVGTPRSVNCMTCHFTDCGLPTSDRSVVRAPKNISAMQDIHLDGAAIAFNCQTCHVPHNGHGFSISTGSSSPTSSGQGCASCHTGTPHAEEQLNRHMTAIACQTCHIPVYAQEDPMMISWNWIMTGKSNRVYQDRPNGQALIQDENGFTAARMIEPVYLWDDGNDQIYTRGERIKPQELTYLQKPTGRTPGAKIAPFRVVYGTQMYDTKYRYLISPLLKDTGSTFFPKSDWENIAKQGMEAIVLPFSGQYGFTATATFKRINHGITYAAMALGCIDCHGSNGRMPWKELGYEGDPWLAAPPPGNGEKRTDQSEGVMGANPYSQSLNR